jgi:hypothetical protein
MGTPQHGQLPQDLVRGQRQLQAWREKRKPGDPIPRSLWALATRLAEAHGVSHTSAALGLDYYRLKVGLRGPLEVYFSACRPSRSD